MTNEKKQEYTLRITQANKSRLVVILYELFFDFIEEAGQAHAAGDKDAYFERLDKAQEALSELILSLNMEVDPAPAIYRVYLFVSASIGRARGSLKTNCLAPALDCMKRLYETYKSDSASDDSAPVMDNSQKVYAGLTYGKGDLTESMDDGRGSRGFFA